MLNLACIFDICYIVVSNAPFTTRAENLLRRLDTSLDIARCTKKAADRAANVIGTRTGDQFYAATWIGMYSQYCNINKGLGQDSNPKNFPFRMNKELRCAFHPKRDENVRELFLAAGHMIDEALTIMGSQTFTNVYRGLKDYIYINQDQFTEEGFVSTSKDVSVALRFANGGILMVVDSIRGVDIRDYAEDQFQYQDEVLGLLGSTFRITQILEDATEISAMYPKNTPRQVIYVSQVYLENSVDSALKEEQHKSSLNYCDPEQSTSSTGQLLPVPLPWFVYLNIYLYFG